MTLGGIEGPKIEPDDIIPVGGVESDSATTPEGFALPGKYGNDETAPVTQSTFADDTHGQYSQVPNGQGLTSEEPVIHTITSKVAETVHKIVASGIVLKNNGVAKVSSTWLFALRIMSQGHDQDPSPTAA